MSYFDDASLVMIPSGYKTSKVYSVKPTSGDGDLTFTRSNDTATRVGPDGLIEKVRTNIALYSEQFDNAYWTKSQATITANATTAPDGTLTAEKFIEGSGSVTPECSRTPIATSNSIFTLSVFAKASERNFLIINNNSGIASNRTWFNLTTGVIGTTAAGSTAYIENVGNGWYRCSVSHLISNFGSATSAFQIGSADGVQTYTGDGTSGIFIWGAQMELSDFGATDYIATTSAAVSVGPVANVPRLDYLNSSCPRLLLEPQRTNAQTYSEDFSQGKYTKTDCTISSNVTATVDPAGYNGSDKLVEAVTVGGQHYVFFSSQTGANQETQISIFAKAAGRTEFLLWESAITNAQARFNLSNGTISASSSGNAANLVTTTPTITSYGNGWYRCTLNFKTAAGGGTLRVQLYNGSTSYNGNGTDGIYIYGLQEEVNTAYATSYIPTLGAAVTRGADAAQKTSASALIGQTEGTIFWEFQLETPAATGHEDILNIDNGSFGNTIYLTKTAAGNIASEIYNSGLQASFSVSAPTAGTYKAALGYANNNTAFFVNGVQVGITDTSCSIPATSRIQLGNGALGPSTGKTAQLLLFTTRLSNSDLAALTA